MTDGTSAGTTLVKDIRPGSGSSFSYFSGFAAVAPAASSVSISDVSLSEGDSGTKVATFTVTRAGGTAAFDVSSATANGTATAGSDYTAASGTVHFNAGETTKTVAISLLGDATVETSETFQVNLSGATNGATIADALGIGTILNDDQAFFGGVGFALGAFGAGPEGGGWASNDRYLRLVGDVNGDGRDDIVGFGSAGTYVSLANGQGGFHGATFELGAFGAGPEGGGWKSNQTYHRVLAEVNGDGRNDIVGFASAGLIVSLATGGGHFGGSQLVLGAFGSGPEGGGWSSHQIFPRELADVNGDGRADIVGFSDAGVVVSLATGGGQFSGTLADTRAFGPGAGGWANQDTYLRQLADVNGDNFADIVGFASAGVLTSFSDGSFIV